MPLIKILLYGRKKLDPVQNLIIEEAFCKAEAKNRGDLMFSKRRNKQNGIFVLSFRNSPMFVFLCKIQCFAIGS